jgi:hypothetical protein
LLVLITDAAGANAETVRLVTEITAHNDVLCLFVFDPLEEMLPDIGRVVVAEAGRQIEIQSSSAGLRSRFAAGFAQRRSAIEGFSRRHAIPMLPLSTERDTMAQLQEMLGRRLARKVEPAGLARAS